MSDVAIRALREEEAEAYVALRRESLREAPLAFAASPEVDGASQPETVRARLRAAPDAVILGAFAAQDGALVGAAGVRREPGGKASHKAHLWGMYVAPASRRRGIGAALLQAAVAHAQTLPGVAWLELGVSTAAPEARRLYEAVGFRAWGEEPDALRHGGESVSELHMTLRLEGSS